MVPSELVAAIPWRARFPGHIQGGSVLPSMSKDLCTSGLVCHPSSGTNIQPQHVADADSGYGKLIGDGQNSSGIAVDCDFCGPPVENKSRLAPEQPVELPG